MKKRYTIEKMPLILEALTFFMQYPRREVYLREYGRILNISPNSAQRFLDSFLREGFITEIRRGHLRYFKANLESFVLRHTKVLFSLRELHQAGFAELLNESEATHAVLFGSVAQGTDDERSDVDVIVIAGAKEQIKSLLPLVQKKMNRELSVQIFSWNEWKQQEKHNKAFYRDVIIKGISLLGEKPVTS